MISKIAVAVAAAIVLASAGAASAQPNPHSVRRVAVRHAPAPYPFTDSYFNKEYWDGIAPLGRYEERNPYAGTVWDGVVPY